MTKLLLAIAVSCLPAVSAHAQNYPAKPVRIIVATSPGGPYDEAARAIGPKLTEIWGQTVIVDNRPGAANIIGATVAARSAPDGYTFFLANVASQSITPNLRKKLSYDPQKDFAPVILMMTSPMIVVTHPSLPVKSVKDVVALAKARPGALNYASAGVGNTQHLAMELLMSRAQIKMNHVPYKGFAPASVDLIAGQVELMFANITGAMPHVAQKRLRAVAVSSATRTPLAPELPPVADTYPGFDVTTWMGLFAPSGTPKEAINTVHNDIARVLKQPEIARHFKDRGADIIAGTPEQLSEYVRRDYARYGKLIKEIGLTPE
ncbi:MAG TPA: tripartite tricarboxylate transporter substrate binding protein [Burkholderiales bacterium]|nr:tripartite tricarboxylate transporter substrate binding protein [Burkholderiales bacterium]